MARTIRVSDIGDYASQQMEKLLRVAVFETDARLKAASPVDTGRFRASWQIGENVAGPAPDYAGNEGGPNANIPPPVKINYQREQLGNVYSVHNNLPYAEKLAAGAAGSGSKTEVRYTPRRTVTTWASPGGGSSIQTDGPGWVQGIAKDMQQFVTTNAARIGRES
jgi:hypothetical protein